MIDLIVVLMECELVDSIRKRRDVEMMMMLAEELSRYDVSMMEVKKFWTLHIHIKDRPSSIPSSTVPVHVGIVALHPYSSLP